MRYPEGFFINRGTALSTAFFSGAGIAFSQNNILFIALGHLIGMSIGLIIGTEIEKAYNKV